MNNQSFSKIWIVIILIILVAGGIFAWQYFGAPKEGIKPTGGIEKPSIKIISPNGGEEWTAGKTYNITWESSGIDKIDIGYRREGSGAEINGWVGQNISASQSSYSWVIPAEVFPGPEYKQGSFQIIIGENPFQAGLGVEEISDRSDDNFIIFREDETTDWKTYRNEEYEYEIKYPSDLLQQSKFSCEIPISIEESVEDNRAVKFSHTFPFEWGDDKGDFHSTLTDISVKICLVKGNYQNLASYYYAAVLEDPVVFANRKGFKIEMGARGAGAEVYYLEKDIDLTLAISFYYVHPIFASGLEKEENYIPYEKQKEVFNQMLSTFSFLD